MHCIGDRLVSKPLMLLKEQHELSMLFCHPAKYAMDKVKPSDIVLDYARHEENPIVEYINSTS
jgi:hypothetical protein